MEGVSGELNASPEALSSLPAVTPVDDRADPYDYDLPEGLIAQEPAEPRDSARLLVLDRRGGELSHRVFAELDKLIRPEDLIIANRTRVLPARLVGQRESSGGRVEALLLRQTGAQEWEALLRPGRRLKPGARIQLQRDGAKVLAEVGAYLPDGSRQLRIRHRAGVSHLLALGDPPLPPYIKRWSGDPERYQTIYGDRPGSAAAPTAGLHFTPALLARLRAARVHMELVTLHVGPDTFRPIRAETLSSHQMHAEWAQVRAGTLAAIRRTREQGGRVVVVGTTTLRAIESVPLASHSTDWEGWTRLFIKPGHQFRNVDALITNFHLPRSTLLVLVCALAGREPLLAAYREAIERHYRFYSFGDAMLVV